MKLDREMKEVLAAKTKDNRKFYHVAIFEVEHIMDTLKNLLHRNFNMKTLDSNSKSVKFKHALIEEELIMF